MLHFSIPNTNSGVNAESVQFSQLLKSKWTDIHNNTNAFRYKIDDVCERLVNNKYLLQLNPKRSTNRRPPEKILGVHQPFDENRFNFTKVSKDEIMFKFRVNASDEVHSVLVNVSPISRYHSMLCPSLEKCLPQIVTKDSLKLAIDLMLLANDRELRIGFNSLCAWASVNHLHYHFFVEKNNLPIESVKCKQLTGPLYILDDYPALGFCFEVTPLYKVDEIFKLLEFLITKSIAHNFLITRGNAMDGHKSDKIIRFVVFPRKSSSGPKEFKSFNVAVCELSGWVPVYNDEDFRSLQAEDLEEELKKWQIDNFEQLCKEIKLLYEIQ